MSEPARIHQPANPRPDPTARSHPRVQPFKSVAWRENGRWRVGQVGYADNTKAEVFPTDRDDHIRVFLAGELDGLRVKPLPPRKPRHEV